jgi:hypothetical protein
MTKAQLASKECVGDDTAVNPLGNLEVAVKRNTVDKSTKRVLRDTLRKSVDPVRNNHDRIRMVQGRKWCMTTYQSCRLRGEPLEKAWKHAFVI